MGRTSTRAVEVSVVILLAVAGISVSLGIHEATADRNAVPWWTAAGATLAAAILIPAIFLLVIPVFSGVLSPRRDGDPQPTTAREGWVSPAELGRYLASLNE